MKSNSPSWYLLGLDGTNRPAFLKQQYKMNKFHDELHDTLSKKKKEKKKKGTKRLQTVFSQHSLLPPGQQH